MGNVTEDETEAYVVRFSPSGPKWWRKFIRTDKGMMRQAFCPHTEGQTDPPLNAEWRYLTLWERR